MGLLDEIFCFQSAAKKQVVQRENLRKGDLVLKIEPTPRRTWKMGLVLETYPGEDGLVRKAKIKTATSVYDRPVHKCLIATKEELNIMP